MDSVSLHRIAFILSSFSILLISPPTAAIEDPGLALLSFKSLLSDSLGSLASWDNNNNNESLYYCTWRGVTCGRRHPLQVIALDLGSLGLAGPISPVISNLTFLRRLRLPDNQLHGRIPEELGRLSRLRHLNLSMNLLQGEIPSALSHCSRLQAIILGDNKLSGEIPSNLTRCFNLRLLSLENNMLGGEIPADMGSLSMLEILNVGDNNLNGRIPPLLGSSPSLTKVGLWNNSLTGGIPPFLANSSALQVFIVRGNTLTGGIPNSLGNSTSLTVLDLASNGLTGCIPPFSTNPSPSPSPLGYLALSGNYLTGEIPPSLGNLSSLQHLYVEDNNLEGSIPKSLGNIPSLQEINLNNNRLSNRVPPSLYNISTIKHLGLAYNRLSGTLPPDMGLSLPNLQILSMQENLFDGPIPKSMPNASGLEKLYLGNNSFTGAVPSNLGSLRNLRSVNIAWNQLQALDWSFLTSLTNCSLLTVLHLSVNRLGGVLPSSVGNLSTRLEWLAMGINQISGSIPAEIGNLVNLSLLGMDGNLFVGSIPAAIGELRNLHVLDLSRNKLSGPIPWAIGNVDQLNQLELQENELSGPIPTSIGSCKSLGILNLSHNALGGTIPTELLSLSSLTEYLDLSYNALVGSIPLEVGQLINLGGLDVSENQLSGDIPSTLGACKVLEHLHMEGNFFQGNIPQSFKDLMSLTELDLSRNNLSGRIPDFFKTNALLQSLNLSFNGFEGELPSGGVFDNASEIFVLGNKRLCGGDPKLQLPSCSVLAGHGRQFSHLKVIIPSVIAAIVILLFLMGILYRRRKTTIIRGPSPDSSIRGESYKMFTYSDLYKATDGFSSANLVGDGSFGSVYKGKIDSKESIVAVKVLKLYQKGASKSFTAECETLRNVRHRNLIKIITTCSSLDSRGNDFKALIFEYMPNGSLDKWLHPRVGLEHPQSQKLTLIQSLNIVVDVVSALDYLHHGCQPPVVHCDLKPSNILLDNDMVAHVGDFGLAKFLSKPISASSIGLKGSIGYVAPEYGMGGQASTQGDVYSFGVLMLEMLTGKKPTDDMFKDGLNLHRYVKIAYPGGVMKILDPHLDSQDGGEEADGKIMSESSGREGIESCIFSLVRIGLLCSNDAPRERMEMRQVAAEIHSIKEAFSLVEAHEEEEMKSHKGREELLKSLSVL